MWSKAEEKTKRMAWFLMVPTTIPLRLHGCDLPTLSSHTNDFEGGRSAAEKPFTRITFHFPCHVSRHRR
jgi:hypothetical protein